MTVFSTTNFLRLHLKLPPVFPVVQIHLHRDGIPLEINIKYKNKYIKSYNLFFFFAICNAVAVYRNS